MRLKVMAAGGRRSASSLLSAIEPRLGAAEVRLPAEGRPRHRPQEQDQRRSRCRHREGQGRGGRREHRSGRGAQSGRRVGPLRHARAHRHSRPRLCRHGRTRILRRRQQRVSRRLHAAHRRDHRGGRRIVGLAELRGLQAAHHRSIQDARAGVPQHRRQRHARRISSSRTSPTWKRKPTADMALRHKGVIVGDQDRALRRPGVGAGRAGGRGRDAREHSRDGGLRHQSPGTADGGARDQEAPAGRHLHPRLFRASQRAGRVRPREPGAPGGQKARRDFRRRPWRRQLRSGGSRCRP